MNVQTRMRPLKAMAFGCKGTSVAVLRAMYVAYIRSVIDYAAPALVCLSKSKLPKLEAIQNEAMRIVLGCPVTARVSNMRIELGLVSVAERIREINTVIGIKALRDDRDSLPKTELLNAIGLEQIAGNGRTAVTAKDIQHYDVVDFGLLTNTFGQPLPPWECMSINMAIDRPPCKKADISAYEMRPHYQAEIEENVEGGGYIDQVYCDGSMNTDTGCAGAAVTLMNGGTFHSDVDIKVRMHDWASSTQTELMALLLALTLIRRRGNDSLIITDSMSALQSLQTSKVSVYEKLVNEVKRKIRKLAGRGIKVKFMWVPSHIGIPGN